MRIVQPSSEGSPTAIRGDQQFLERQFGDLGEMMNLGRAETVDIDLREVRFDIAQQLFIPFQLKRRMQAPLHQNLVAPHRDRFFDLLEQHFALSQIPTCQPKSVGVCRHRPRHLKRVGGGPFPFQHRLGEEVLPLAQVGGRPHGEAVIAVVAHGGVHDS